MRLGVLYSGGKDSTYALYKAMQKEEVACLITIKSKNPASYMFHTPAVNITNLQAESMGIPLVSQISEGKKEEELLELRKAILEAKKKYRIEGVVTGAIESVYQSIRVQRICYELDLWCFNPLWQIEQVILLKELIKNNFKAMITGIAAYPFDESWLGRIIDNHLIEELIGLQKEIRINPSGEGGEYETTVLNAPFFKHEIDLYEYKKEYHNHSGRILPEGARLK